MEISISKQDAVEIIMRGSNGSIVAQNCVTHAQNDYSIAKKIVGAGPDYWDMYRKAKELMPSVPAFVLRQAVKASKHIVSRNTPFYKTEECVVCCSLTIGGDQGYFPAF